MNVLDRYLKRGRELKEQGKTGYECSFCGVSEVETNRHGTFCKGCAAVKQKPLGVFLGMPIYDPQDVVEIQDRFGKWMI